MKNILFVILIFFISNVYSQTAEEFYEMGLNDYENDNYENSVLYFNKAILLNSNYINAYMNRGHVNTVLKKYSEAMADYFKVIELDSLLSTPYFRLALIYAQLGNNEESDYFSKKSSFLTPEIKDHYIYLAISYESYKGILDDLERRNSKIQLDPTNANYYYWRGVTYRHLDEYSKSISDFTKAINLEPYNPTLYNDRGVSYAFLKKYSNSISDFTMAIELDSVNTNKYYYNRGLSYKNTGDIINACNDWYISYSLKYINAKNLLQKYCK